MEKKTIYYILGGVAVIGIGYYLWNKNKNKSSEEKESTDATAKTEESTDATADAKTKELKIEPTIKGGTASAPAPAPAPKPATKKLTAQELESKLQSGCGKKPLLKKNKIQYNKCRTDLTAKLKSQGLVAFDGSYYFEGVAEINRENNIREMSFAEQVINREDGRLFAGNVYNN
jgi:FtsZ-interacting cell division protein ZipA